MPEIDQGETAVEKMEKPGNTLAKNFLIGMAVTCIWSTAVEMKTSANWALNSSISINKAHTYIRTRTYYMYIYTHTNMYMHTYTHEKCMHTFTVTCIF